MCHPKVCSLGWLVIFKEQQTQEEPLILPLHFLKGSERKTCFGRELTTCTLARGDEGQTGDPRKSLSTASPLDPLLLVASTTRPHGVSCFSPTCELPTVPESPDPAPSSSRPAPKSNCPMHPRSLSSWNPACASVIYPVPLSWLVCLMSI